MSALMTEQYVKINAVGMSFGRPKHKGGYYDMGDIVSLSELKQYRYSENTLQTHLEKGIVEIVEELDATELEKEVLELENNVDELEILEEIIEEAVDISDKPDDELNLEEYWQKYKEQCPRCKKRHKAKLALFDCKTFVDTEEE